MKLCVDLVIGVSRVSVKLIIIFNVLNLFIYLLFFFVERHFQDFEIQNTFVDFFSNNGTFICLDIHESSYKATIQNSNYDHIPSVHNTRDIFLYGD